MGRNTNKILGAYTNVWDTTNIKEATPTFLNFVDGTRLKVEQRYSLLCQWWGTLALCVKAQL